MKSIPSLILIGALTACGPSLEEIKLKQAEDSKAAQGELYNELKKFSQCKEYGYMRAEAMAQSPEEALSKARASLARQVKDELSSIQLSQVKEFQSDLKETWSSEFQQTIVSKVNFENAALFKSVHSTFKKGWYGEVVCAEKARVAEPLEVEYNAAAQKFKSVVLDATNEYDPSRFKNLHEEVGEQWRFLVAKWAAINVLKSDAKSYSINMVNEKGPFEEVENQYKEYQIFLGQKKANFSFGWTLDGEESTKEIGAILSQSLPLKEGDCESGLNLGLRNHQVICKNGGLGFLCSINPQLTISSCDGKELKALPFPKPLKAVSPQSAEKSTEKVWEKLKKNVKEHWVPAVQEWTL